MPTVECPSCGRPGKGVQPITLRSLLEARALAEAGALEGYRHCAAAGCDVAYFAEDGRTIDKSRVRVRIGTKQSAPPRPVCYCFDRSWESIEAELRASGTTDAIEDITARCRAGEDRCPETNPQGSCCLGNVRRAVAEAQATLGLSDAASHVRADDDVEGGSTPSRG